ncbi:hypothetical protein [Duganella hordei]|uniref:hypothetical protein n=1 Tax=Duganella hordei TaxID=2865934 RepID=UPI0030E90F4F
MRQSLQQQIEKGCWDMHTCVTHFWTALGVLTGAFLPLPSVIGAPHEQGAINYEIAEPPFSDRDLVRILGNLSGGENGFISKQLLEHEFKMQLTKVDPRRLAVPASNPETYGTTAYVNWYFDMLYSQRGRKTEFSFGWGNPPNKPATPMAGGRSKLCVSLEDMSSEFVSRGWVSASTHFNPTFTSTEYIKGYGKILFSTSSESHCMISILISSIPAN